MKALLALEDGTVFEGESIGRAGRAVGEVVFNTSMTGYQEMLTDPSYRGQILTLTYPLIGNYGTNPTDFESAGVQVEGLVIKQLCDHPSNWQSVASLDDFLRQHGVIGIAGVDTRALTRRLRKQGVMMGAISSDETAEEALFRLRASPRYDDLDWVQRVSTRSPYQWSEDFRSGCSQARLSLESGPRVAVVDLGAKYNILRILSSHNCEVIVLPSTVSFEETMRFRPKGVVLSPGPGDPARLAGAIKTAEALLEHRLPTFGICLGHQLLGWALGSRTFKLKFGHRGANHPVKEVATGVVSITAQNHGYAVEEEGLRGSGAIVSHINLNDGTVEGLDHRDLPVFSLQYHPEASPGPKDSRDLFAKFLRALENH
jgi:carbamoyl-phosphate synthase small subunit